MHLICFYLFVAVLVLSRGCWVLRHLTFAAVDLVRLAG